MTDLSELVKNLSQMQNSLHEYRGFLETQRENTIKSQFQEFSQSLGIDSSSETIESLFESFEQVTEILDESDLPLRERILKTLDSDFVAEVLSLKTAARESELRRMTSDLSEFIRNLPKYLLKKRLVILIMKHGFHQFKPKPNTFLRTFK